VHESPNAVEESEWRLHRQAANAKVAGHHALTGNGFEESENLLTFAKGVEENGQSANVHRVCAEPDQVRIQAAEFGQQNTNPLGALGDFQIEKFLDGQAIAEIVGKRIEVVDAVGEWDDLL
jgi:hypothetical protein